MLPLAVSLCRYRGRDDAPTVELAIPVRCSRYAFLLDSGAYTAWNQVKKGNTKAAISLEAYARFVHENKRLFRSGVFSLDEIGNGEKSYENWRELSRLGVESIPVYHMGTDEALLLRYLDQSDYIAIGAVAKLSMSDRLVGLDRLWRQYLLLPDGSPRARVHGLGITATDIVLRYPWFSVDSSTAAAVAAHGGILIPKLVGSRPTYSHISHMAVSDQQSHGSGTGSFYGLSPRARQGIIEYIESHGYSITRELSGQQIRPLRSDRKHARSSGVPKLLLGEPELGDVETGDSCKSHNLTNHWLPRTHWNLDMIDRFLYYQRGQGHHVRWYNVATEGIFPYFVSWQTGSLKRILVSYAYAASHRFLRNIKEAVKTS